MPWTGQRAGIGNIRRFGDRQRGILVDQDDVLKSARSISA
jgi:hypothetical protein